MKIGYPDTINSKAYQGETSASPFKMVDKSKADLDKDGKVSEYESKRADAAFGDTPINMNGPLYAKDKPMSDKRRARRKKRVEKIEAKANSIAEQKYLKGVADEDLPTTAKKSKVKKYNRLIKKADRISAKTTKILRDNNQVPSAKKKPVVAKAKSSSKKIPKVKKTKVFVSRKDYGGKDDLSNHKDMVKQMGVEAASEMISSMKTSKDKKSPIKADSAAYTKLKAANKAAAEKAKKAEAAIRKKESADKSSEPAAKPARKKTMLGRAIAARKVRRNDGINDNAKAKEREIGRRTRKENKEQNKKDIKEQKAIVTKARQDKRIAKATTRQTERLDKVTKKVVKKVEDVKKGTGLGISKDNPAVGNVVRNIVTAKNKKKDSPAKFASAAQRKAVWASKNEKKKK